MKTRLWSKAAINEVLSNGCCGQSLCKNSELKFQVEECGLNNPYQLQIWGGDADLNGYFSRKCSPVPISQIIIEFFTQPG
jgi:hypothetical protein